MTRLSQLDSGQLVGLLRGPGVVLRTGPFHVRIRSPLPEIVRALAVLYPDCSFAGTDDYVDFDIELKRGAGLRRWTRRQARFVADGFEPFLPLPQSHAGAMLEWGMNWCITSQAHQFLILHAAVLERHGRALILPAPPGSGKSTLCAALASRGWRLLSDELALVSLQHGNLWPLARPIGLKNESIAVIRAFDPSAIIGDPIHGTTKGTVAHVRPAPDAVARIHEPARPAWIVFPRWGRDAPVSVTAKPRAASVLALIGNAFNYSLLGRTGFQALVDLVRDTTCHDFRYGSLNEAVAYFEALATQGETVDA